MKLWCLAENGCLCCNRCHWLLTKLQ